MGRGSAESGGAARRGGFELLVKVYEKGTMSKHLGLMSVGDTLEVKGPIMKLPYETNMKKKIGMIAGALVACCTPLCARVTLSLCVFVCLPPRARFSAVAPPVSKEAAVCAGERSC